MQYSNKDNKEIPLLPNAAAIQFLRQSSTMLDLPTRTAATAIAYYHRFTTFMNTNGKVISIDGIPNEENALLENPELLTTTCLQLACKATDIPRKVRDIVNVGYRYYHPNEPTLDVDETYFKMRASLVTGELLLVRGLGFDLEVELPFAYCLNVLRGLASMQYFKQSENGHRSHNGSASSSSGKRHSSRRSHYAGQKELWRKMENDMNPQLSCIARLAWVYIWDSLCSPKIFMTHSVPCIGLGCLYLALRTSKAEIYMTMNEYVDMWGASDNISVQAVQDVITDLLAFYEHYPLKEEHAH